MTNVSEIVQKLKPLYILGEIVKWCNCYRKQYELSSKKLKIGLPYGPAIPFPGISPKEIQTRSRRDICSHMFTALFAIAKR